MKMGRSHHAPLTRRCGVAGRDHEACVDGIMDPVEAPLMPTSALCGSHEENESQAARHPSSVLG
jgi:hypothetical protein